MSMTSPRRLLRLFPVMFVLSMISALSCDAVSMDVTVGFDGTIKNETWAPIAVRLANSSADSIKGEITIEQPGYGPQGFALCSARVDLPANSRKLYHVYVRPPRYGGNLTVALVDSGRLLAKKEVSVTNIGPEDRLVVTVGPRPSPLNFIANTPVPQQQSQQQNPYGGGPTGKIVVGTIMPSDLPDRVAAYQGVSVIVLPEFNPSSASPKSLKALSMWVASGGLLVVPGGADYRRLQNDFFDELLPVTVTGATTVSLESFLSRDLHLPSGVAAVTQSTIKRGIGTQLAGGHFPIVAVRSYVAGAVVFLAFDAQAGTFSGLSGQTQFWSRLALTDTTSPLILSSECNYLEEYGYGYQYGQQQPPQNTLSPAVEQNEAIKTPSFTLLSIFLLAYLVVLVPVNYTFLRIKKRLELAWVTTPAIVVLFTMGAYVIGYATKGNGLQTHQITFIEASAGCRYAAKITDASIFSPARRSYDVEASDPYSLCKLLSSARQRTSVPSYVEENACVMERVGMAMWSSRTLESTSGEDLGGALNAKITENANHIEGEITNNTGLELRDCRLYFHGNGKLIGTIRKGETVKIDGRKLVDVDRSVGMERGLRDLIRNQSNSWDVPILIGYSDSPPVFKLRDARTSGRDLTCCAFRLETTKVSLGASVSAPVAQGAPPAPPPMRGPTIPVMGSPFSNSQFNSSTDGWSISVWRSASFPPATMAWSGAVGEAGSGGIRCEGSGQSDSDDRSTREGGEIRKTISTVGYRRIMVYYSARVNTLGGNYTGPGSGGATVDHNLIDDQLTVYYSTNGGKSWTEAENVRRDELLRTSQNYYNRRMINLVGMGACANNPNFALRFRWQVNGTNDAVDLDNIIVTGS
jgi:hypothetical protein